MLFTKRNIIHVLDKGTRWYNWNHIFIQRQDTKSPIYGQNPPTSLIKCKTNVSTKSYQFRPYLLNIDFPQGFPDAGESFSIFAVGFKVAQPEKGPFSSSKLFPDRNTKDIRSFEGPGSVFRLVGTPKPPQGYKALHTCFENTKHNTRALFLCIIFAMLF